MANVGVMSGRLAGFLGTTTRQLAAVTFAAVTVLAVGAELVASRSAEAQTGQLQLIRQTPYVAADGELAMQLRWTGPLDPQLTLSATIFAPIDDEEAVAVPPADPVNRFPAPDAPLPLTSVPRSEQGFLNFAIPIRSFTSGDNRIWLQDAGVYPVIIEVRGPDGPVSSLRTHLIRLPTETAEIPLLPAALVLNVSSADGLELPEAIGILQRHPSLPMTVLLEDGVLTQLTSDPEVAAQFRAVLGDRTVTAMPSLNLDPSALAEIDQGELYGASLGQSTAGFDRVGLSADPGILPLDTTLTVPGAVLLGELGVDIVVDLVAPAQSGGSIASGPGDLRVVRIDDDRTAQLGSGPRAVERGHLLLAALAVRNETDRSPVIIGGTELRSVDINALEVVLTALDQPGLIEAINVRTAVSGGPTVPLRQSESPDQDLRPVADDISSVLARIATYEAFHVSGGPSPVAIEQSLLSALSRDRNPDDRQRAIDNVAGDLDTALGVIELPGGQSFTLATRSSPIPLSITNASLGDRLVLMRFQSDRIDVAEDGELVNISPGTSSVDINVEALSLGVSPLEVVLTTPDGRQELARTRFQIRSTAIPGLGYLLSGAALVFLITWWIVSVGRSRAVSSHPSNGGSEAENTNGDSTNGSASADANGAQSTEAAPS